MDKILKEMLRMRDMDFRQLADQADVPIETIRNIYYGKVKNPKVDTLISISKVLGCSVNHLCGAEIYTQEEIALIENFRKCGKHGKSIISLVGRYEAMTAKHERMATDKHLVPCLVPQGTIKDGFEYKCSEVFDVETNIPDAYSAIQITSNYFSPSFCKGDIVLLADRFPESGERAVFVINGIGYLRKFIEENGIYSIQCINRHSEDIRIKRTDEVNCIGTYTGVIRT